MFHNKKIANIFCGFRNIAIIIFALPIRPASGLQWLALAIAVLARDIYRLFASEDE